MDTSEGSPLQAEAATHYQAGMEQGRLSSVHGQLEMLRTQELLQRHLPAPPAVLLDVGGGPGAYALWLAGSGYSVQLVDAVPLHIEQARQAAEEQGVALASLSVGDARNLAFPEASADAVLLMGPLYHLTERTDRLQALREAYRVLRAGGLVFAVGISRFASALDGLFRGYLTDPLFAKIVAQDLTDGQHRNPTDHPAYFTTAFFHHPYELLQEVMEAGFQLQALYGIEGPGGWMANLHLFWEEEKHRETLLSILRSLENEPSLQGLSAHLLAIGKKEG